MTARFLAGDLGSVGAVPERVTDLWGQRGEFSCGQLKSEVPLGFLEGKGRQETSPGRAAEPGLGPGSPGSTNGGPLLSPHLLGDFPEGRAEATGSCCTPCVCPHVQTKALTARSSSDPDPRCDGRVPE